MQYTTLPNTDLKVSKLCLGTMTWGQQNSEAEAHGQLDFAMEQGINFIDTAEMYPIPGRRETQGSTEQIIGNWLTARGNREKIVLASKIAGPNRSFAHIRKQLNFSKASLDDALGKSLKRLQTNYLDLYQLHWPERPVNIFGKRDYPYEDLTQWEDTFAEVLDHLETYIKEGKVRYAGLSNETPYGIMRYMEETQKGALKMVSVQNGYNLLNRRDEIAVTEVLKHKKLGYLAYSPLAFGQLSGKYLDGSMPKQARVTLFPNYSRYHGKASFEATKRYLEIADNNGLSLVQMALAFVRQRPFVTAVILGATTLQQLSENIGSIGLTLSEEIINEINAVHKEIPNPAP
jgi:aryl-alcohol dehydrogenase-like predicted oxidoreductase